MAFTLDTTYTLYIENPNEKGTTLRIGKDGYSVERVEAEDGTRAFNISSLDGTLLYSGVKRIGLDQDEGKIIGMASWECRKVEVLETGYVTEIAAGTSDQSNEWIEEFEDEGNIVEIGRCGFYMFTNMKQCVLPSIKILPERCFYCSNFKAYKVFAKCITFGAFCFDHCTIEEFVIDDGALLSIACSDGIDNCFGTCYGGWKPNQLKKASVYRNYETNYRIKDGGRPLFQGDYGLRQLFIGGSCAEIKRGTARGCPALKNLTLGEGIITISEDAFIDCPLINDFVMPKSVTSIATNAFKGCTCCVTCTSAQAAMLTEFAKTGTFNIVDD